MVGIPKHIFQTFEVKQFSSRFQEIIDSWKIHNPTYAYTLHDNKDREEFIKTHFPRRVLDAYHSIIPYAYKADLWRYCILYLHGGVFADVDTLCVGSIDEFLEEGISFMAPIDLNKGNKQEGYHNVVNGFIAVTPKSPIMLECIDRIVSHVETNTVPASKLDFSGPGLLGRCVNKYLGNEETASLVGKEGVVNGVKLLHFERDNEYVHDGNSVRLFQNKNGNPEIQQLYKKELEKVHSICWLSTSKVIRTIS